MEIKELHLRNIASIEKADIDFDKDLVDGLTGTPASVFLISGDTGAGKSVILDGISMALYKNTPRIAGVANVNHNVFTDNGGESIKINAIEQYTRLGITEKDESSSEVVFIGNDGLEYRAKLTLGMMLGNTDKATGKRMLKHRTPDWKIKAGNGDWMKCSNEIILAAVGLSFQQFGRMAMLAQGQFAAFLTGDKKEREAILEQLTNTEHFTAYGAAIRSLYDKANAAQKECQIKFDTEKLHALTEDEVRSINAEKDNAEKSKSVVDGKMKANEDKLRLVDAARRALAAKSAAEEEVRKAAVMAESDEYKSGKALVCDWDATAEERQRLSERKRASEILNRAKEDEARCREKFAVLSADLEYRLNEIKAQGDPNASVEACQKKIDDLKRRRGELRPDEINAALSKISSDKVALGRISSESENIRAEHAKTAEMASGIESDKKSLAALKSISDRSERSFKAAREKADEAMDRFLTMNTSVDEYMKKIRARLVADHAETCPLCGQNIGHVGMDGEFQEMLAPLRKERDETAATLAAAEDARNKAKAALDSALGAISTRESELGRRKAAEQEALDRLASGASKFGITIDRSLSGSIAAVLQKLESKEQSLKKSQKRAEELQKEINDALDEKKPLDAALKKYTAAAELAKTICGIRDTILSAGGEWEKGGSPAPCRCADIAGEWTSLLSAVSKTREAVDRQIAVINECNSVLDKYFRESGKDEAALEAVAGRNADVSSAREFIKETDANLKSGNDAVRNADLQLKDAMSGLGVAEPAEIPQREVLEAEKTELAAENDGIVSRLQTLKDKLAENAKNSERLTVLARELASARKTFDKWSMLNGFFGGTRFRTLVQTYILRPLLNNANLYLEKITDRYSLTCSEDNEQLSILVLDRYNKNQVRSATVLSGGERFMISLALSLALSSLNRPDMNVNILFIDEGFGTLDERSLDSVMETLEKLQEIAGQGGRRVGIISHREELDERIPVQIQVKKRGEGRSRVEVVSR